MKILYITDPVVVGGATQSLVDVVTAMKERGADVTVCTSSRTELNEKLEKTGILNFACGHMAAMEVRVPSIKYYITQSIKYYRTNKKAIHTIENTVNIKEFDLIHTNSSRNDIGMILSKRHGIKHICHLREFGQEDFNCWCYRWNYINFYNKYTDYFIAISNAVKNSWARKGIVEEKIKVIYNGVNDQTIESANIESFVDCNPLRMIIVGGVCRPKGQEQIIEAINLLPSDVKKRIHLDIVGWGDEQYIASLKSKIKEYKIENLVSFLGARKDIGVILKKYHVGLMCSRSEGFGRVTAEYMHAGLGVIASNTGANTEIVEDDICGLIYHLDNYSELANCIKRYYADRIFLMKMAKAGQDKARKNYTKELNADNIFNFYKFVINE